ncbi:phospholipase A1 member A isoform X2 [Scyliorhinus canicula]|uniref:phospholipase A1 member A isoform X2 n=1 Tax=Scyliorhinus canicula TaxID=7830 RepID=UPI0018F6266F|nr:phospholipase A1 member A isoform X2 [Scyliorhinus canicula]
MSDRWDKALLLGSLILLVGYRAVNGNISQNCSDFQTSSWRNVLQRLDPSVQFMLLTRRNPDCAQPVNNNNDIQNSNFNGSLPTKLIMHGYRITGSKPSWVNTLAKELIRAMDVNVVVVDWIIGSTAIYHNAVQNSALLGFNVSTLIVNLISHGSTEDSFHLIGVSLGAHVAGFVGRMFKGKLGRITDFGISRPVGHIDFYLNDGKDQPGCARPTLSSVYKYLICDHIRAIYLYISSIKNHCPLVAFPCETYEHFTNGECIDCYNHSLRSCPRIGLLEHAGLSADVQPKEVKVYLMTSSGSPFCVKHFLVEIIFRQLGPHEQRIEIKFLSNSQLNISTLKLTIPNQQSNGRTMRKVISYTWFENVNAITIRQSSSWHRKRYAIHFEKLRIRELPLNDSERPPRCINNIVIDKKIFFEQFGNCF